MSSIGTQFDQERAILIEQLKLSMRKIGKLVVIESCTSWTNRLYHMSENNGNYLC